MPSSENYVFETLGHIKCNGHTSRYFFDNPVHLVENITSLFQDKDTFSDRIIERFKEFLDDEVLRSVAAEGIAKLMYNRRLVDAQLFSRLLLLWYNPTTEGDPLRHCLGMFFSTLGGGNE